MIELCLAVRVFNDVQYHYYAYYNLAISVLLQGKLRTYTGNQGIYHLRSQRNVTRDGQLEKYYLGVGIVEYHFILNLQACTLAGLQSKRLT